MSIKSEQHVELKTGGKSTGTSQLIGLAQITPARSIRINDATVGKLARRNSAMWKMMFAAKSGETVAGK